MIRSIYRANKKYNGSTHDTIKNTRNTATAAKETTTPTIGPKTHHELIDLSKDGADAADIQNIQQLIVGQPASVQMI